MELDQSTIKKIRGLILYTVIVVVAGVNYRSLLTLAGSLLGMAFPFLLGGAIAFILNVPMRCMERHMPSFGSGKWKRAFCLVITLLFVTGIAGTVVVVVLPELLETLSGLQKSIPEFLENIQRQLEVLFAQNEDVLAMINQIQIDGEKLFQGVLGFLSVGASSVLSTTFLAAKNIVSGVTSFGIGLIFAIYILVQKENLGRQAVKVIHAYLPDKQAEKMLRTATLSESIFSSFLTGQCVEAVILGMMFFITLSILRMPYAVLIGVLIAFTALIPIFGAFIGCAVGAFLILMVSPMQALSFIVIFLILQQIEGNLIYPHVVGNSVGLPSIWVLVAVTLGGSMMGIVGMLIFIPLVSVLYTLFREHVNARLAQKNAENAKKTKKNPVPRT